ncbi:NADH dehydrogenase subunit 4 [Synechocystis sp. PCC 6803]|jgi:NAD(P)H-quinone oxidoreductase subunit 4|uniref:NAD(P)H-quinone oxidoreductase chain 4-1 n=1 Tax=Synechocystis sp. (strain ATCC 27184 / PCC 6803 / Kazusa) TaxID=1111708 RepID=NU4C1_SYNY3|nr:MULTISPECIES: NAD(P)H-quinone oxidoreductase subunit 4 [unclassified Synechocystis]P32421.1 RecName: Full=NAD(P)H-quinone oxidoreductase chain 4-1; AltName: Full=NAD(P)H dehydrogenase I, subunit D-1; AltName: Full=NDH-1, chain 4-1 [Synechocystis sp. PCC 6803 substr. Kazusa]BAM54624.1 NAD(P)H-quinone oxidoreductase subunit 4 [Synechocystis sp. PCC 6803] [Bacillus subtilis BEST7613]AGF52333.1 NADH dehydrogenase subunit 4 [Synechocystis sp. PCC 6803]ALJ68273.1 NAD(P)H-quinone oxidoreductase sub
MNTFPWLTTIILLPIVAALFIPIIPDKDGKTVRWYSLAVGLVDFALIVYAFYSGFDLSEPGLQLVESYTWLPQIDLKWSVGADGLSMPLIILTGFITTLATMAAWPVTLKPKLFYFLMLLMYGGQIAVFAVQDILLFFLVWELELVPVYLILSIWGGKKRLYAATKFILYTAGGSLFILLAGLTLAFYGDVNTFDMSAIAAKDIPVNLQLLLYAGFLIAYGVKLPIFPLHTWLPDAHGEATAPAHMLLAGILLKMGGYALLRMNVGMLPDAHAVFAPVLVILGVVNIIYAAFTSFAQRNLKRKIAYSSISHMGFVLIGLASFTDLGMSGAMLQMISHGLIGASLFFMVGATYDRTHTLMLDEMGGIGQKMKKGFAMWTACSLASLALPGMSGFVAELMVFVGFATSDAYNLVFRTIVVVLMGVGVILTPIYLLSMLREMLYGPENEELVNHTNLVDVEPREVFIIGCLLVPIIGIGFYPKLITQIYDPTINQLVQTARRSVPSLVQQANLSPLEVTALRPPTIGF